MYEAISVFNTFPKMSPGAAKALPKVQIAATNAHKNFFINSSVYYKNKIQIFVHNIILIFILKVNVFVDKQKIDVIIGDITF